MLQRFSKARALLLVALCCFPLLFRCEVAISQTTDFYYPAAYAPAGATRYFSGSMSDLQTDEGGEMIFQSYPSQFSSRSLYAHQETINVAGTDYYAASLDMAEQTGTDLSLPLSSTGRKLLGKFIYPLTNATSIASSTWTIYYRAWFSNLTEDVSIHSPSWIPQTLWVNADYAYSSDDAYAIYSGPGIRQQYGNYGIDLPLAAHIIKVEVGYEAYAVRNELISISLSWDGGSQWTADYVSPPLRNIDSDVVDWVDFTANANWTANMLSDTSFRSRVAVVKVGPRTDEVLLDWLPVRVTYIDESLSAHLDADICVRKLDGAIRQTLAPHVANSELLSTTARTLSGTCDWLSYTAVDETDYLEIDYFVDIASSRPEVIAHLRIDDVTSVIENQTRIAGFMVPSEYTAEVEFSGGSNTNDWSEIVWTIDSSWTVGEVSVTQQLYDHVRGTYPTSGSGYIAFQSSSVSNIDETRNQTITANTTNFRDEFGNWKIRIRGTKSTTPQFSLALDLTVYQATTILNHDVAVLGVTYSPANVHAGDTVAISATVKNEGETMESFNATAYYDENQITRSTVTNLNPSESMLLIFYWNTTGTTPGAYTLKVVADAVENESDRSDNIFIYGDSFSLLPAGDGGSSSPPWNWTWALLGLLLLIPAFVIIGLKKRKGKLRPIGFEFFDKITEGGIPDSFSVMLVGGSDSAKGVLFQELAAHLLLKEEKPSIYVAYECFPGEIRENLKKFQFDTSVYEQQGRFLFIDCFSSTAKVQSSEKYFLTQPFSLVDLGIAISKSTSDLGDGVKLFLDSITPLLTQHDPARVIDFLEDRIARVKGVNGNLVFTSNGKLLDPALMSQLEETIDCIVELDANEVKGKMVRRLRIKKLRGKNPSDEWIQFTINPEKGVSFLI